MDAIRLQSRFLDAWNAHDLEAILSMVSQDCVFITADNREFQGIDSLREFFPTVWARFPNARWNVLSHARSGDRGFSEWIFTGTDQAGLSIRAIGIDVYTFRGDKICKKDAFRKGVSSAPDETGR